MKKIISIVWVVTNIGFAQTGALDLSFDLDGKVTTALGPNNNSINDLIIQSDGKLVAVGNAFNGTYDDIAIARYNSDGSLDLSFNSTGTKIIDIGLGNDVGRGVALQPDGKILIAGEGHPGANSDFCVIRLNPDGSFDNTFDTDGIVTTDFNNDNDIGYDIDLQSDGKIVVGGAAFYDTVFRFAAARYNTNGSLDNSFSTDGKVDVALNISSQAYSIAIQPDDKILLAGSTLEFDFYNAFAVVRLNYNGSFDTSFDTDGIVTTSVTPYSDDARDIAIQPDGKLVVVGGGTPVGSIKFAVVRYNSNGSLDNTWNGTGTLTTSFGSVWDEARSVIIQPDGKILAGGIATLGTSRFAMALYNTDGTLFNGFDTDGKLTTSIGSASGINSLSWTSDGKILAGGYANTDGAFDFALARYGPSGVKGIEDPEVSNVITYPNPFDQNITIEYTLNSPKKMSIELVDIHGKVVEVLLSNQLQEAGTYTQNMIVPTDLPAGNYFIVLSSTEGSNVMKVVKK